MDLTQTVLEIAHVLFVDIVAYSAMSMEQQKQAVRQLQQAIESTTDYARVKDTNDLIILPTGDGAALVFFRDAQAPARCALELAARLSAAHLPSRMGIHSGPVYRIADINANRNVSGGGINLAQRVMDVGDAGHILVSRAGAELLQELSAWRDHLHDLGDAEVKHGVVVRLFNLYTADAGNPAFPSRFRRPSAVPPSSPASSNDTVSVLAKTSSLQPGATLLHYRITRRLGAGGMGIVYEAEDTRLGRRVALKFLTQEMLEDEQAVERFQREARAASALNHPHICTVYDVGKVDGLEYIAMELLEGATLKQVIVEKRATVPQMVRWGAQIADALQSAHSKGIVHRDLKPANIFITDRDEAKVLDFGLAKLSARPAGEFAESDLNLGNPWALTSPGAPMGTVAYMSPEQARGGVVDLRTDIFSFGMVLYELATGNLPFPGATSAVIFDGILNRTPPPISDCNPNVPTPLQEIIDKALAKQPDQRYQSAAEMRSDLENLHAALSSGNSHAAWQRLSRPRTAANRIPWARYAAVAAVLLAVAGAAVFAVRYRRSSATVQPLPRQLTFASPETAIQASVISPDGKYIAYGDPTGLFLRLIATGETRKLAATAYVASLCWTPDTSQILVAEGGSEINSTAVSVVSTTTGSKNKLLDHAFVTQGCSFPDSSRVALIRTDLRQVWTIGIHGEEPSRILDGPPSRELLTFSLSHDGKWLAVMIDAGGLPPEIQVCNSAGQNCSKIIADPALIGPGGNADVAWEPDGHLVYSKAEPPPYQYNSHLWRLAIGADGHADGPPAELLALTGSFASDLSFTNDGRQFSYTGAHLTAKLRLADLDNGKLANERPITGEQSNESPFAWSRDGRSLLSFSTRPGGTQILRRDLDSGNAQPLATGAVRRGATITGDGVWVLYTAGTKPADLAPTRILRVPVKGGAAEVVLENTNPLDVSCAAGPKCLVTEKLGEIMRVSELDPLQGRGRELLRLSAAVFANAQFSPDGKQILSAHPDKDQHLTMLDLATGKQHDIHVERYGSADSLTFAPDGRSLYGYFWSPTGSLVQVDLDGHTHLLREFPIGISGFAVSPDGKRIVFGDTEGEANVWLVER